MSVQVGQTPPGKNPRLLFHLLLMHLVYLVLINLMVDKPRLILLAIVGYIAAFAVDFVPLSRIFNACDTPDDIYIMSMYMYSIANRGSKLGFQFGLPLAIMGILLKVVYGFTGFPLMALLVGVVFLGDFLLLSLVCPKMACACFFIYRQNRRR